jgi:hypothetical protein
VLSPYLKNKRNMLRNGTAPKRKCGCGCGTMCYFNAYYVHSHRPATWAGFKQSAFQKEQARKANSHPKSAEHCRNSSIAARARVAKKGYVNPFKGKTHTLATRKRVSSKLKGRVSTFLGLHHSVESKHALSLSTSRRMAEGWIPWRRFRYVGEFASFWMRSSWEVAFAEYLDELEWPWLYEAHTYELSCGYYTPDFYIPHSGTYIEVKGALLKGSIDRIKKFTKETGKPLLVLFQKDLKDLGVLRCV